MIDPRPDLKGDTDQWKLLLTMADMRDPMMAGALHGFRCAGCRLTKMRQGWRMESDLDPATCSWETQDAFKTDRDEWLLPYREEIVAMLQEIER